MTNLTPKKHYRVRIINVMSVNTACGYGEGSTLKLAQQRALDQARRTYGETAELSDSGYEVLVASPVSL